MEEARTLVREWLPPIASERDTTQGGGSRGGAVTLTFEQSAQLLDLYGLDVVPFEVVSTRRKRVPPRTAWDTRWR